jgi:hypothetical protein
MRENWQILGMVRLRPVLLLLLFTPCFLAAAGTVDPAEEARALSSELVQRLGAELRKALAEGGPEGAISVCRDIAPRLAGELSRRSGGRVARVSLRTRNPLIGLPDAWEQQALRSFDQAVASGAPADGLEALEIVDEPDGRYLRYLKALPAQAVCLTCHGDSQAIAKPIRETLARDYPHDRATGYAVGQIRGAVTVKQRLSEER